MGELTEGLGAQPLPAPPATLSIHCLSNFQPPEADIALAHGYV